MGNFDSFFFFLYPGISGKLADPSFHALILPEGLTKTTHPLFKMSPLLNIDLLVRRSKRFPKKGNVGSSYL